MVGSGSLLTGQSGSPLVEREFDNDSFGLLSGFGVPGPFTFLHKKKITFFMTVISKNSIATVTDNTDKTDISLLYHHCLLEFHFLCMTILICGSHSLTSKLIPPV